MRAGWYAIKATLVGYEPGTDDVLVASSSEMAMSSIALSKGSSIPVARSRQRYGTPRLPSDEVRQIGGMIVEAITVRNEPAEQTRLSALVREICSRFPVPGLPDA